MGMIDSYLLQKESTKSSQNVSAKKQNDYMRHDRLTKIIGLLLGILFCKLVASQL